MEAAAAEGLERDQVALGRPDRPAGLQLPLRDRLCLAAGCRHDPQDAVEIDHHILEVWRWRDGEVGALVKGQGDRGRRTGALFRRCLNRAEHERKDTRSATKRRFDAVHCSSPETDIPSLK